MTKKSVVEAVLLDIYEEEGVLVPETIVERARVKSHPLHSHFEWDNKKAGDAYRLLQATQMIVTFQVQVVTPDESYKVRAFHALSRTGLSGPGYVHESDIPEGNRQVLLQNMNRDWVTLKRRYQHLAEFWALVGEEREVKVG